ncbi:TadE family protein [Rhizobium sp. SL42]|uniref:TadE family protein n=1 Tax=Rhizobium sp. SL42 TaxID=2806346 RepID=UPI001F3AFE11|nr:TadE family protein [Rhizobium sp. SL42]UJW77571.1 pilus assembly protein [Rhizobium sp. SL42]
MTYLQRSFLQPNRFGLERVFGMLWDTKGNAAIEFALVTPIFALVFVASVDLGMVIFSRFQLEAAVSASASYAIAHADQVDSINGDELAKNMALMIASNYQGGATAVVNINNGSKAYYSGSKIKIGGAPSGANACYCPTGTAATVDWGSGRTCGTSCPDGGRAGRYVSVTAQQAYTPFFSMFDVVNDGFIAASAIVQTQ